MVFIMVIVGGLTRLTGAGLSMVDWRPVTGWLPPLNQEEWQSVFALYKLSPQYLHENIGMSLDDFKNIFWLEFFHRLWGRLIGASFALPLTFFIIKGWVRREMIVPLCMLFILGGAQGVLGWYMVKSGLVDNPEVSQYRLMAHLGFAFFLYAALIWTGLSFYKKKTAKIMSAGLKYFSAAMLMISFGTILAGALVAGLNAGLTYNTFPLMDGDLIPPSLHILTPWYLNHFENITTVQFQHRFLAIVTVCLTIWMFIKYKNEQTKLLLYCLIAVVLQVLIGILTLLLVVPIELASLHQAGGLLVITAFTWLNYEIRR